MAKTRASHVRGAIRQQLVDAIAQASGLEPSLVDRTLVRPRDRRHGDHTFPGFGLVGTWELAAPECAARLADRLVLPGGIVRAEPAGGYLNFFEDRRALGKAIVEEV